MEIPTLGAVPILGQPSSPSVAELVIVGNCPICLNLMFAHGAFSVPTAEGVVVQHPQLFPLCDCDFGELTITIPKPYDGDRERTALTILFNIIHQLFDLLRVNTELPDVQEASFTEVEEAPASDGEDGGSE